MTDQEFKASVVRWKNGIVAEARVHARRWKVLAVKLRGERNDALALADALEADRDAWRCQREAAVAQRDGEAWRAEFADRDRVERLREERAARRAVQVELDQKRSALETICAHVAVLDGQLKDAREQRDAFWAERNAATAALAEAEATHATHAKLLARELRVANHELATLREVADVRRCAACERNLCEVCRRKPTCAHSWTGEHLVREGEADQLRAQLAEARDEATEVHAHARRWKTLAVTLWAERNHARNHATSSGPGEA